MIILHKENVIGVKRLTDSDLGTSETSNQTHIGLSEKVLTFLPDQPSNSKGILVFKESCYDVPCLFSKINDERSTKTDLGPKEVKKSLVKEIRNIASGKSGVNWFVVWFALFDETPVFWLFTEESDDFRKLNSICELVGTKSISANKNEFFSLLKEINKLDKLKLKVREKVQNCESDVLVASSNTLTTFVRLTLRYFESVDDLKSISTHFNKIVQNEPISVFEKDLYDLQNLFVPADLNQIKKRNIPRTRWYTDSFECDGFELYLYNDWYETKSGNASRLYLSDLIKMYKSCYGDKYFYKKNGNVHELWKGDGEILDVKELPSEKEVSFNIDSAISAIKSSGLIYDDLLIKRFATSLLTKPFAILSGLAGSGKTQLALAFAKALIADDSQMCVVSVGADWTNREPLLGYPNALKDGEYVHPESGVLDLLVEADKPENKDKPYFLILDEMNLSYVERYFADFLSAMESHEPIRLWDVDNDNTPKSVSLPKNLFIVGTINVDETTYMFSPKVLDRANVIEFKVSEEEMTSFLDQSPVVDLTKIEKIADQAADFVRIAKTTIAADNAANDVLKAFFKPLKEVNAEFGYRTAVEIGRFIALAKSMASDEAVDSAIVQKLLPKLHGSRKKIVPVLKALWKICVSGVELESALMSDAAKSKYPLAADKMYRMYQSAIDNGFTSFAEA